MISITIKARNQYNLQKLQPATLYNVRLLAFNKNGPSVFSEIVQYATTGKPPPPMPNPPGLQLATSTTLRLFWDRQSQDERYMLQMYDVHSRRYNCLYNGSNTFYECCNLQRSTDYKFRLRADNEYGSSDWSAETRRPSKPQVKGKIQGEFFRAKWEPPTDRVMTQADIKLYHLEISSGGKFERIYSGPEPEAICDRLSPGTTYQIRVSCEGPGGQLSNYSDVSTVTTEAIAPGQPEPPRAIDIQPYAAKLNWINIVPQASTIGGSQQLTTGGSSVAYGGLGVVVHISWQASKYSDPKVTDPIEYIVQCSLEKDSAFTEIYRGLQTKCSIDFLVPGSSYFVRICPIRIMMNGGVGSNLKGQFSTPQRLDVPQLSEIKNSLNSQCLSSFTTMGTIISGGTPSHQNYNQHQSVFAANSSNSSNTNSTTGGTVGGLGTGSGTAISSLSSNHHPHNNLRQRSSSCGISPSYNTNQQHQFQKDLVGNVSSSSTFGRNFLDVNPFSGKQPLQNLVNYNYHNNL
uniref:Fibronectin type-III domain-containing protein n=1 Tax=Megaselia scalaris TaxID=36166 RepID=T1GE31_MEGSC